MIGVVLAGGASTRMGRDKALVEVDGVAMARRVADALQAGGCRRVVCQGGDAAGLVGLGLEVHVDPEPGRGPLAAIGAALARAGSEPVLVAACDLADLDAATVATLISAASQHPGADAVVAGGETGADLLGVWSPGAAVKLEAMLASGLTSYRAALDRLDTISVRVAAGALRNVNTPGDLWRPG